VTYVHIFVFLDKHAGLINENKQHFV